MKMIMRYRILLVAAAVTSVISTAAFAETWTYRQIKDISVKEGGKVRQSDQKGDLFEYTFNIDMKNNVVTRTKIRRLDEAKARDDATVFNVKEIKKLWGSEAGRGGRVIVASSKDGTEIIELGSRFAFTTRTSPFSQVITGVYRRMYDRADHKKYRNK